MKNLIAYPLALLFFFASINLLQAQEVKRGMYSMSLGTFPGFEVEIPDCTQETAGEVWEDKVKMRGNRAKKDNKTNEWVAEEATYAGIGGYNMVNVYSRFSQSGNSTIASFWFQSPGGFIGGDSDTLDMDEVKRIENLIMNFTLDAQRAAVDLEIEAENETLEDLQKELTNLEKNHEDMVEDIADCTETIEESKAEIEQNLIEQESIKAGIEEMKNQSGGEKQLKRMEKDLNKHENDYKKLQRDIEKCEQEIEEKKDDIGQNIIAVDSMKEKIHAQKEVIKQLHKKRIEI